MSGGIVPNLNIVLLGPPGAGKGTQAALLENDFDLEHISTGDLLRAAAKEGSETGTRASEYMSRGELVPDDIVTKLLLEKIFSFPEGKGVMLDGYPRTAPQACALDSALKNEGKALDMVLFFRTSEEVAVQRLSGRRVCSSCKKNYHIVNMPPSSEGVCDKCGGSLVQRKDDDPITVRNRLAVYKEQTAELIDYYKEKGILKELDGDLSAGELFKVIADLFSVGRRSA